MNVVPEPLQIPDGLQVGDSNEFLTKLGSFSQLGAAGLHVVFDFDRTLTVKRSGSNDEVTTWHILNEHLPVAAQQEYQQYFAKYRALEVAGEMNTTHAVEWWSAILDLFVTNRVSLLDVEHTFLDKASVRPGTQEFFALLRENEVPSTILSAGIRNVIALWAEKYGIDPTLVLSTELEVDPQGIVTGWDRSSLVHVLNKHEADHPELRQIRAERPNTLVIGDGIDDSTMATGDANVLRVRILDRRDDDPDLETEKARTFDRFDALITSGSLRPLCDLIGIIIDSPK